MSASLPQLPTGYLLRTTHYGGARELGRGGNGGESMYDVIKHWKNANILKPRRAQEESYDANLAWYAALATTNGLPEQGAMKANIPTRPRSMYAEAEWRHFGWEDTEWQRVNAKMSYDQMATEQILNDIINKLTA